MRGSNWWSNRETVPCAAYLILWGREGDHDAADLPPIGVARVGDRPDFFIGPERPGRRSASLRMMRLQRQPWRLNPSAS